MGRFRGQVHGGAGRPQFFRPENHSVGLVPPPCRIDLGNSAAGQFQPLLEQYRLAVFLYYYMGSRNALTDVKDILPERAQTRSRLSQAFTERFVHCVLSESRLIMQRESPGIVGNHGAKVAREHSAQTLAVATGNRCGGLAGGRYQREKKTRKNEYGPHVDTRTRSNLLLRGLALKQLEVHAIGILDKNVVNPVAEVDDLLVGGHQVHSGRLHLVNHPDQVDDLDRHCGSAWIANAQMKLRTRYAPEFRKLH